MNLIPKNFHEHFPTKSEFRMSSHEQKPEENHEIMRISTTKKKISISSAKKNPTSPLNSFAFHSIFP